MSEFPVSDGRPPRHGGGVTSASSHPELVSGDFAVPPRRQVRITSLDQPLGAERWRASGGMLALLAFAVLVSALAFRTGTTSQYEAEKRQFARTCMQWHLAAGAVVSRLVQSTRDSDLLQVSDSVFRMRRARRNCESGWVTLACQDYHAVAAGLPGYAMTNQLFPCSRLAGFPYDRD